MYDETVKKEEIQGNLNPIKSAIYAAQLVQRNELKLDFWGRTFLKLSVVLGVLAYIFIGWLLLQGLLALIVKLF